MNKLYKAGLAGAITGLTVRRSFALVGKKNVQPWLECQRFE
jgi:hypothetical protein